MGLAGKVLDLVGIALCITVGVFLTSMALSMALIELTSPEV